MKSVTTVCIFSRAFRLARVRMAEPFDIPQTYEDRIVYAGHFYPRYVHEPDGGGYDGDKDALIELFRNNLVLISMRVVPFGWVSTVVIPKAPTMSCISKTCTAIGKKTRYIMFIGTTVLPMAILISETAKESARQFSIRFFLCRYRSVCRGGATVTPRLRNGPG